MKIRVNFQGQNGDWYQGEIVGYTSCYEGRVEAIILADRVRDGKPPDDAYEPCEHYLVNEWIGGCTIASVRSEKTVNAKLGPAPKTNTAAIVDRVREHGPIHYGELKEYFPDILESTFRSYVAQAKMQGYITHKGKGFPYEVAEHLK